MPHPPLLIDTHCHLDAAEFDRDRGAVQADALARGVGAIVIPAIGVSNFARVAELAAGTVGGCYALGIHPMVTPTAHEDDLVRLREAVAAAIDDPRFVAVGEIGLDLFVPSLATQAALERQTGFLDAQLKIARDFDLPVLLHVRRAQDPVLAALRRARRHGHASRATGIAHAFNGSRQQAGQYIDIGFKLGFGGAATFERALRIRALARELPDEVLVLETDAPDIAPQWVASDDGRRGRNAPGELAGIAAHLAALRGADVDAFVRRTTTNALDVLPRIAGVVGGDSSRPDTRMLVAGKLAASADSTRTTGSRTRRASESGTGGPRPSG